MVYVWLAVIGIALIVEASTATLVAIWFIPSAIVSAVIAKLGGTLILQVAVFLALSIVFVLFARKIFARTIAPKHVPTNADSVIGEEGIVTLDIDAKEGNGLVKVKGQIWSAKSENGESISEGAVVEVLAIEGVKLIVKERI